jgi:hypothetical protein
MRVRRVCFTAPEKTASAEFPFSSLLTLTERMTVIERARWVISVPKCPHLAPPTAAEVVVRPIRHDGTTEGCPDWYPKPTGWILGSGKDGNTCGDQESFGCENLPYLLTLHETVNAPSRDVLTVPTEEVVEVWRVIDDEPFRSIHSRLWISRRTYRPEEWLLVGMRDDLNLSTVGKNSHRNCFDVGHGLVADSFVRDANTVVPVSELAASSDVRAAIGQRV